MPCKGPQKGPYFLDCWSLVCFEIGSYLALNFRVSSSFLIGCSELKLHRSDAVHKWCQPILHIYGTQNKALQPRGPSELKQIMGQSVENPMGYHGEWTRYYFGVYFYHQIQQNLTHLSPRKCETENVALLTWSTCHKSIKQNITHIALITFDLVVFFLI